LGIFLILSHCVAKKDKRKRKAFMVAIINSLQESLMKLPKKQGTASIAKLV